MDLYAKGNQAVYHVADTLFLYQKIYDGKDLNPGDTIILEAGLRDQILFKNITGSGSQAIQILNGNGKVEIKSDSGYYGFAFRNCRYFRISGQSGKGNEYGIFISKIGAPSGVGITIEKGSSDAEIDHVEITQTDFAAIIAKSDPDTSLATIRDSFTLYNLRIHDNYIHDILRGEAMYIGHSKYKTGVVLHYPDHDTIVMPHVIKGVQVYDNRIERTGFDGIQVSSAVTGCAIFNNLIINDSQAEKYSQMNGIIVGGGSRCDCYNNQIYNGLGTGISYFGQGKSMIYNNLIVRPGIGYFPDDSTIMQHGIFVSDKTMEDQAWIYLFNNTIVQAKSNGIRFLSKRSAHNKINNNLIVEPGFLNDFVINSSFLKTQDAFIYLSEPDKMDVDTSINHFTNRLSKAPFDTNNVEHPYALKDSSELIDVGMDLVSFGVLFDMKGMPRPNGFGFDIGAYESSWINNELFPDTTSIITVYPNPVRYELKIKYELKEDSWVNLILLDEQSRPISWIVRQFQRRGTYIRRVDVSKMQNRNLFLLIEANGYVEGKQFTVIGTR